MRFTDWLLRRQEITKDYDCFIQWLTTSGFGVELDDAVKLYLEDVNEKEGEQ